MRGSTPIESVLEFIKDMSAKRIRTKTTTDLPPTSDLLGEANSFSTGGITIWDMFKL